MNDQESFEPEICCVDCGPVYPATDLENAQKERERTQECLKNNQPTLRVSFGELLASRR